VGVNRLAILTDFLRLDRRSDSWVKSEVCFTVSHVAGWYPTHSGSLDAPVFPYSLVFLRRIQDHYILSAWLPHARSRDAGLNYHAMSRFPLFVARTVWSQSNERTAGLVHAKRDVHCRASSKPSLIEDGWRSDWPRFHAHTRSTTPPLLASVASRRTHRSQG